MSALGDTLRALKSALDAADLRWFLFGAQAVAIRGAPRATQDVDVTVEVAHSALPTLMERLENAGLVHRYPEIAAELLQAGAVIPLLHELSGMEVDLVVAASGLEQLAQSRAEWHVIDGVDVPVAQATDLVVMKVLAGRGKDLDDVCGLVASGDVDQAEVVDLLAQLEEALGQSDLLPRWEEALDRVQCP